MYPKMYFIKQNCFKFMYFLQPINDVVDYPMANSNQYTNHNPQTPSSIPNIILTADDGSIGSDEELQRVLASANEFDFTAEDMGQVLGGLGKVDDTMLRLLSDNNVMDQQLADPATEEHLKNV
jgi:hypothetical protein